MRRRKTPQTAKPMEECDFPRCEECDKYIHHKEGNFCTAPVVVSKQTYLLTNKLIASHESRLNELEDLVYAPLIGGTEK